ncbi:MAG: hypothetical protein SPE06_08255 [[Actinobacillus] rossii]|nr:hypothetical protein [[Actinobacillus] rossii]MDY4506360.1 hypothetical protein [[Actinobacillus] rossii]
MEQPKKNYFIVTFQFLGKAIWFTLKLVWKVISFFLLMIWRILNNGESVSISQPNQDEIRDYKLQQGKYRNDKRWYN